MSRGGALPLLQVLHAALAVGILSVLLDGMAGRPFLPGLGWWALLFAAESFSFTARFFVRDPDGPRVLRGVEAVLMLLLAKAATTAPVTGWGLAAWVTAEVLEPWAGVLILGWAWFMGLRAAYAAGALDPSAVPDPEAESIQQNDHGEAFDAMRNRLLAVTGLVALLAGLLPAIAGPQGWTPPAAARWIGPGLVALALLTAAALVVGARLRQQITWALERLTPPQGVLTRWAPQALALILLPLLLAAILPAGPRLPVERLLGREQAEVLVEQPPAPAMAEKEESYVERWAESDRQVAPLALPPWVRLLLLALVSAAATLALAVILFTAYRQLAERLAWGGARAVPAFLRRLLRWYGSLWQALLEAIADAVRGGSALAAAATGEAARAVFGQTGLLGRYLPALRRPPAEPRAAVRFYFARLQAVAARRGLGRPAGATAGEFAARLAAAAPDQGAEIARLREAYERARYSDETIQPEQVSLVRRAWQEITKALGRR